jgi:hypothetical protein
VVLIVARKNGKRRCWPRTRCTDWFTERAGRKSFWQRRLTAKLDGCSTPPPGLFAVTPACPSGFAERASARESPMVVVAEAIATASAKRARCSNLSH